jgi:general secretion pathway protein J
MMLIGGNPHRVSRGFTLLEMLVAITLLGLVMATITSSLGLSSRMSGKITQYGERAQAQAEVRGFLRRQLHQLAAQTLTDSEGKKFAAFYGEPGLLRFVAPMARAADYPGLHWFELFVDTVDGRQALLMRYQPYLPGADAGEWSEARVLLGNLEHVEFAYFGGDDESDYWADRWIGQEDLPALVQVSLADSAETGWSDMMIRPQAETGHVSLLIR